MENVPCAHENVFSSVQFSCSVVFDSSQSHESQCTLPGWVSTHRQWCTQRSSAQSCTHSQRLIRCRVWTGQGVEHLRQLPSWTGPANIAALLCHPQTSRDVSCVVFALFNVVWSTLFLEEWKRRGAELAYKWGTLDSPGEAVEEPRPQFRVSRGSLSSGTSRMEIGRAHV